MILNVNDSLFLLNSVFKFGLVRKSQICKFVLQFFIQFEVQDFFLFFDWTSSDVHQRERNDSSSP
jgi:hypothetical protein